MYCWTSKLQEPIRRKISCNWTAEMEAGSNKISRHYFTVENKLKPDDDVKSMLKKIYEQEFTESNMIYWCYWGDKGRCVLWQPNIPEVKGRRNCTGWQSLWSPVTIKVNRCHLPKQQVCCHEEVTLHEMKSLISLKTLACLVSTVLFLNNGDTITGPYDIVTIINNYFASIAETTKIYIYIYIYIFT